MNKRLTSISSSKEDFDEAMHPPYQKALDESGCTYNLTYSPQSTQTLTCDHTLRPQITQTPTRNRKRNRQKTSPGTTPIELQRQNQHRKKVPQHRGQMFLEESHTSQDHQQAHAQT